jgi:hypothetical protein
MAATFGPEFVVRKEIFARDADEAKEPPTLSGGADSVLIRAAPISQWACAQVGSRTMSTSVPMP